MLAARRLSFPFTLSLLFALAAVFSLPMPLPAQVPSMEFHGVPPSGIGGMNTAFSAVPPNVVVSRNSAATLGCCASFFFPSSFSPLVPYSRAVKGHHGRRRHQHPGDEIGGGVEPVYVPYPVPYAVDSDYTTEDQDDPDEDVAQGANVTGQKPRASGKDRRYQLAANGVPDDPEQSSGNGDDERNEGVGTGDDTPAPAVPAPPEVPVVAQPTTMLVFKDGHRLEVVNYAIVGDTLFDFSGDRTHKIPIADLDLAGTQRANEALGVEFKLPPAADVKSGSD